VKKDRVDLAGNIVKLLDFLAIELNLAGARFETLRVHNRDLAAVRMAGQAAHYVHQNLDEVRATVLETKRNWEVLTTDRHLNRVSVLDGHTVNIVSENRRDVEHLNFRKRAASTVTGIAEFPYSEIARARKALIVIGASLVVCDPSATIAVPEDVCDKNFMRALNEVAQCISPNGRQKLPSMA